MSTRASRCSVALVALVALAWQVAPTCARAQFAYRPAGELVSGSGRGRADAMVYAPGIRFPIERAPAFLNSQVWGVGGASGRPGSQCDAANYSYPWHDNYCESRSWSMPMCPAGVGHQGQDIRPSTCADRTHDVVATVAGTITHIGTYSVYLTGDDGRRYDYLHMRDVRVSEGMRVARGARLGRVSNNFGSSSTTIHLHFNIRMAVSGFGSVYAPTYMSLVRSYEALLGVAACSPHCEGSVIVGADCGRGDCAAFGATCTTDGMGTRCVYSFCPPTGEASVCIDGDTIGHCVNGTFPAGSIGECGAFAAFCSTAGVAPTAARCVSVFCAASPETPPVAHDGCWFEGGQYVSCDANGIPTLTRCPAGQACTVIRDGAVDQPHCGSAVCAPTGESVICVDGRYRAHCLGGSVIDAEDCGDYDAVCSTAGPGGAVEPRCVASLCVGAGGGAPVERDVCLPDGTIAHCDAQGGLGDGEACPGGTVCEATADGARCGGPALPDAGVADGSAGGLDGGTDADGGERSGAALRGACVCRAGVGVGRRGSGAVGVGGVLLVGLAVVVLRVARKRSGRAS